MLGFTKMDRDQAIDFAVDQYFAGNIDECPTELWSNQMLEKLLHKWNVQIVEASS